MIRIQAQTHFHSRSGRSERGGGGGFGMFKKEGQGGTDMSNMPYIARERQPAPLPTPIQWDVP